MTCRQPRLPELFLNSFIVEHVNPFRRHLNCLEVEIGGEDYRHLLRIDAMTEGETGIDFSAAQEITDRLLSTTQNSYNRVLLERLRVRIYLDLKSYAVYYRLPDKVLRFSALWRDRLLTSFFSEVPQADSGWQAAGGLFPEFEGRFLPDESGGVLLVRRLDRQGQEALLTTTHAPYDPHTLELTLHALRASLAGAALINLGFSGREPLPDENLEMLKSWGVPLNPSSIDSIYPYADVQGQPFCYKLEKQLPALVGLLGGPLPPLIIDLHGYVGTHPGDERLIVGLGGASPFSRLSAHGHGVRQGSHLSLHPRPALSRGLRLLRSFSREIHVQFCTSARQGYNLRLDETGSLHGQPVDLAREVVSLLPGECRSWVPGAGIRWLPGSGGNALQRRMARLISRQILCLHVEVPTSVRRRIARHGLPPAEAL
jgi:hypothetical protein